MDREERLILWNQLEILKYLNPSARKDYEVSQETLSSGYTLYYSDVFNTITEAEEDEATQKDVLDILDMFRALHNAKLRGWAPSNPSRALFEGFDLNNDDHYGFADHLLGDRGLFAESAGRPRNSHSKASLPRYQKMMTAWKQAVDPYQLTDLEAEAVIV